jgi:hypothetical protein
MKKISNLSKECINIPTIVDKLNQVIDQFNLLNAEVHGKVEPEERIFKIRMKLKGRMF